MTTLRKKSGTLVIVLCVGLCIAAGCGGRALALRFRSGGAIQRAESGEITGRAVAHRAPVSGAAEAEAVAQQAVARALAQCTTEALWEQLHSAAAADREDIARELLEREGLAVLSRCEALPDELERQQWTVAVLGALAERDRAKALELCEGLPPEFFPDSVRELSEKLMGEAAAESTDAVLATLDGRAWAGSGDVIRTYAEHFEFQKVLDRLAAGGPEVARRTPRGMCETWAERSPLAALDWLRAHPDFQDPVYPETDLLSSALAAIARSSSPEREEALLRTEQYYDPAERDRLWSSLSGWMDPAVAEIAGKMGSEDAYLASHLEGSRSHAAFDAGWAQIPAERRDAAAAKVLADWKKKDSTPNGDRAREIWQASFDRACGK